MLLNEISFNDIPASASYRSQRLETLSKSPYCFDEIEPNIKLYHLLKTYGTIIYIVDHSSKTNPITIGQIILYPHYLGYQPSSTVNRKYRGKELGLKTYKSIILKLNLILISGRTQSYGSSYLWTKLWHDPKIFVCGLRVINNKKEYFQVEPDEFDPKLLTGKHGVYDNGYNIHHDDYEDHHYAYQNTVNDMYQNNEISRNKAIELIKKYRTTLKKEEKHQYESGENTYLIATKEVK